MFETSMHWSPNKTARHKRNLDEIDTDVESEGVSEEEEGEDGQRAQEEEGEAQTPGMVTPGKARRGASPGTGKLGRQGLNGPGRHRHRLLVPSPSRSGEADGRRSGLHSRAGKLSREEREISTVLVAKLIRLLARVYIKGRNMVEGGKHKEDVRRMRSKLWAEWTLKRAHPVP